MNTVAADLGVAEAYVFASDLKPLVWLLFGVPA
jgi:hypothetical protein